MRLYSGAVALFIAVTIATAASAATNTDVADDYLAAYSVLDLDKMASLYAEDAVFTDPTSLIYGPDNAFFNVTGRDAIISKFRGLVTQLNGGKLTYDIRHKYEAAGYVVYQGMMTFSWNGGAITGTGTITTVIHVKGGKIQEHRDYFDYGATM